MSVTSDADLYEVDPQFFTDREADMSFTVHTVEVGPAEEAIRRAATRLELVTYNGREFPDAAALEIEVGATNGGFDATNASYISDSERSPSGLSVYVDTDGIAPAAMGSTFMRIVSEELSRSGVTSARIAPLYPEDHAS